MTSPTMLEYYQTHHFNPVPLDVDTKTAWESHYAKRRNLYERHLGIPLAFLRGRSVLEFGCNSGENALVLAMAGANLTLVEPNTQVYPRLWELFNKFGIDESRVNLVRSDIEGFESDGCYDLVIAEGFLNTLPNRNEMIAKISKLMAPGGLASISFIDRYGCLLELTKRVLLWRACQLANVLDVHSDASLEVSRRLFSSEFNKINASRTLEVWWKDMLVSPFFSTAGQWSYLELIPLIDQMGCQFYSSSPSWATPDHFGWYKNVPSAEEINSRVLTQWYVNLPFFLTGRPSNGPQALPASSEVITAVARFIGELSDYAQLDTIMDFQSISYPTELDEYLNSTGDPALARFSTELNRLYKVLASDDLDALMSGYHNLRIRSLWGTPYHYLCFTNGGSPDAPFGTSSDR